MQLAVVPRGTVQIVEREVPGEPVGRFGLLIVGPEPLQLALGIDCRSRPCLVTGMEPHEQPFEARLLEDHRQSARLRRTPKVRLGCSPLQAIRIKKEERASIDAVEGASAALLRERLGQQSLRTPGTSAERHDVEMQEP